MSHRFSERPCLRKNYNGERRQTRDTDLCHGSANAYAHTQILRRKLELLTAPLLKVPISISSTLCVKWGRWGLHNMSQTELPLLGWRAIWMNREGKNIWMLLLCSEKVMIISESFISLNPGNDLISVHDNWDKWVNVITTMNKDSTLWPVELRIKSRGRRLLCVGQESKN